MDADLTRRVVGGVPAGPSAGERAMCESSPRTLWRRRRSGTVTVNVNEVLYERLEGASRGRDLPIHVVLLAWSLTHERANTWA